MTRRLFGSVFQTQIRYAYHALKIMISDKKCLSRSFSSLEMIEKDKYFSSIKQSSISEKSISK